MADLTDWADFCQSDACPKSIQSCKPMQTLFDTFYKFPSTWWHCTPKNWVQKFLTHLNVAEKVCDTFKGRAIKLIHTLQIFKTLCEENVWKRCKTCQVLAGSFEMLFFPGLTLVKADICLSQNCRLWSLCNTSSGAGLQTQRLSLLFCCVGLFCKLCIFL